MEKVVLEESTNTHTLSGDVKVLKKMGKMNTIVLDLNGCAIVEHGHHAIVKTEDCTKRVIKITQQEYNPITKGLQNSFD